MKHQDTLFRVWVYPLVTLFLWGLALILVFRFFMAAKLILLGFLAVGAVTSAVHPIAARIPGPRWFCAIVAVLIPFLVMGGIFLLIVWFLAGQVQTELSQWPELVKSVNGLLVKWSHQLGLNYSITVEMIWERVQRFLMGSDVVEWVSVFTDFLSGFLLVLVFIFFGSIYILSEPSDRLIDSALRLLAREHRPGIRNALSELSVKLRWWLIGTLISMSVIGIISGLGFGLIGLQLAIPLALLAGIAELVPTVGPLVAFFLAFLFALTQGTGVALGVLIVYSINQIAESYILLPYVMKQTVKIPPVITLFSIVLWGSVFGLPGLLLAIPIDLVIWTLLKQFAFEPSESEQEK